MNIIDLSEVHALARDLQRVEQRVVPAVQREVERGAFLVQGTAQVNAPVEFGTLRNSITTNIGDLSFAVGPEVEHGRYVEEGTTGPYPIENAFGWGILVMHPGISPQPYLGPAFDEHYPRVERGIAKAGVNSVLGRG